MPTVPSSIKFYLKAGPHVFELIYGKLNNDTETGLEIVSIEIEGEEGLPQSCIPCPDV